MKNAKHPTKFGRRRRLLLAGAIAAATLGLCGATSAQDVVATQPSTRPADEVVVARAAVLIAPADVAATMPTAQAADLAERLATERETARAREALEAQIQQNIREARAADRVRWTPAASAAPVAPVAAAVAPAPGMIRSGQTSPGKLVLSTNRTELRTTGAIKRVSVGQPEVADVQPFSSNILLVTAKKPGSTQVIVWDDQDRSESIDVNVEIPLEQLRELIGKVAPGAKVEVAVAADQIVLRGQVANLLIAKQIADVAAAYGKVQNLIEVAGVQTVAVQVQFAEVSRSVTNSLGVNWGINDGTSVFGSQPGGNGPMEWGTNTDTGYVDRLGLKAPGSADAFGLGTIGGTQFSYFIKALRDNSMLRVLQEPTLTTTSGEPASFLAGGQVAVPVPADNGTIGIEYKEFGVRLLLTPIALGNGKIKLVMEAESSDLDYSNGTTIQGAAVPGLRTRRVQNTVELGEGQTISVAGLLDDSVVATKQSVPLLGDIPVLGQLFRSTRYQRKETELVVLITPRLAGAMNPGQVPPLPGAGWRHPSELEQFAFGDMGGNAEADAVKDWNKPVEQRGLNAPPAEGGLSASGRIAASRQGRDASVPPPMFLGDHGFAPATPASSVASVGKD